MTDPVERQLIQHPRSAIRLAVKEILSCTLPEIADRLFLSRFIPFDESLLPCVLIYTPDESSEIFTASPQAERRTLTLHIAAVDKLGSSKEVLDIENTLDDRLFQIDNALYADPELKETVERIDFQRFSSDVSNEGNRIVLSKVHEYETIYYYDVPAAVGLRPFESAELEIDLDNDSTSDKGKSKTVVDIPQEAAA